jgi:ABC-2 type transport system permease protein
MLRVGFSDAVAYRAEMIVWVLSTTMPLVMLALFSEVARQAPIGRFDRREVTLYFLCTFVVRQLTGSWAAWQINYEVRQGALATRLLRPVSPLVAWSLEGLAATPLRLIVALPVAFIAIAIVGGDHLPHDPLIALAWCVCILGAWTITVLINLLIGTLSLFTESTLAVMSLYTVSFFVFSGYLVPVELFPRLLARLGAFLPFRYQIGLGVELMTGAHDRASALAALGEQWAWVLGLTIATTMLWRSGLRRFSAYGG